MSYSVIPIEKFKKEAKRLVKKYPSLKKELIELATLLKSTPTAGISLGNNAYKIRISIKSCNSSMNAGRVFCSRAVSTSVNLIRKDSG